MSTGTIFLYNSTNVCCSTYCNVLRIVYSVYNSTISVDKALKSDHKTRNKLDGLFIEINSRYPKRINMLLQ